MKVGGFLGSGKSCGDALRQRGVHEAVPDGGRQRAAVDRPDALDAVQRCADAARRWQSLRRSAPAAPTSPARAWTEIRLRRCCASRTRRVSERRAHRSRISRSRRLRVISSSAPNGSSISSRRGSVTSARAIDTRICMPPDSSRGKTALEAAQPDQLERRAHSAARRCRSSPARSRGRRTLRSTLRPRHQSRALEHEGEPLARRISSAVRPQHHAARGGLAQARRACAAACSCRSPKARAGWRTRRRAPEDRRRASACTPLG